MPTHDSAPLRYAADDRISLADASALARRDRKTLMKDIGDGRFPNATQALAGRRGWTLLVQDLLDTGLIRADEVGPLKIQPSASTGISPEQLRVIELEARVQAQDVLADELRAEVARLHELAMALVAQLGLVGNRPGGAE